MAGRIGALAIRPSNGTVILGAAQGGIWTYDRRRDVDAADGQPAVARDRRARDRAVERHDHLRRHRRGRAVGRQLLRQRRHEVHRRRHDLDARLRRHFRGVSIVAASWWTRPTPTTSTSRSAAAAAAPGAPARPTTPRSASRSPTTAASTGRSCKGTTDASHGATDLELDPQPDDAVRLVLGRRDVQVHRRRQDLDADHERRSRRRRLRAQRRRASRSASPTRAGQPQPCSTPASTGSTPTATTTSRVFKSTNGGASWAMLPGGHAASTTTSRTTAARSASTTTSSRSTRPTRTSSTPAGSSTTTSAPAASTARTTAARPGRTSATTCTPTSTRSRSTRTNSNHILIGNDGGVWYSDQPRRPAGADRPAHRRRLAEPQRHGRPDDRRA